MTADNFVSALLEQGDSIFRCLDGAYPGNLFIPKLSIFVLTGKASYNLTYNGLDYCAALEMIAKIRRENRGAIAFVEGL